MVDRRAARGGDGGGSVDGHHDFQGARPGDGDDESPHVL